MAYGEISCERKELIPNSDTRQSALPLVLFKSDRGVFGINGAAKRLWSYTPIEELVLPEQRDSDVTAKILNSWLKAGLALCVGDTARARLALHADASEMNGISQSRNMEQDRLLEADLAAERRIYREAVAC